MSDVLKQCRGRKGCGRWLPATPEYFHRDRTKESGLDSWCKDCKRKSDLDRSQDTLCFCGAPRALNVTYCQIHDTMFRRFRIGEIKEWHRQGKVWVPPTIPERRDARSAAGYLYVATADENVIFGIAGAEDLVEARLREHEKTFPDLEYVERFFFEDGEAGRVERDLKKVLRALDHFPFVPRGTPKWTEVVSFVEWERLRALIPHDQQ